MGRSKEGGRGWRIRGSRGGGSVWWTRGTMTSCCPARGYGNKVILPSFSLIDYIRNEFQTEDEIDRKRDLELSIKNLNAAEMSLTSALKSLRFTKCALIVSIIALLISSMAEFWNVNLTKKEIYLAEKNNLISEESLEYTKLSSTDSSINLIFNQIKEVPFEDIEVLLNKIDITLNNKVIKIMQDENKRIRTVRIVNERYDNIEN
jgi:hypothetical protein